MAEVSVPDVVPAVKGMIEKMVGWIDYWCGVVLWVMLPMLMLKGTWVALQMGAYVPQPNGPEMVWLTLAAMYAVLKWVCHNK